jgi:uncharacterized secreted protein with C-terminal beta-propeller domain
VKGLAPGERIQSTRFVGDKAYVVTFRQRDPLFTIDLSNPTSPRVAGELKIPGFSTYLHPVNDDLLIGFGRDVDEETGRDKGIQVSLFDVSDPSSPKRVATRSLSESGEHSEAAWDHHAFSYFPEQRILAVPVTHGDGDQMLAVLKLNLSAGSFELLGEVQPPGAVRRSLRIGDVLYAVTDTHLQARDLDQPGTVLGTLKTEGN